MSNDGLRLTFSILWIVAFGCFIASTLLFVLTWGDYLEFFAWSLGGFIVATAGVIISSLT